MSSNRPPAGLRWFARIVAFDVACPKCDQVYQIRPTSKPARSVWDPRTARFCCRRCDTKLYLGVVGWRAEKGSPAGAVPADQIPTVEQAHQMRAQLSVWAGQGGDGRKRQGEDLNVLADDMGGWTADQAWERGAEEEAKKRRG